MSWVISDQACHVGMMVITDNFGCLHFLSLVPHCIIKSSDSVVYLYTSLAQSRNHNPLFFWVSGGTVIFLFVLWYCVFNVVLFCLIVCFLFSSFFFLLNLLETSHCVSDSFQEGNFFILRSHALEVEVISGGGKSYSQMFVKIASGICSTVMVANLKSWADEFSG